MFRPIEKKSIETITSEWDALAPLRFRQIYSGDDLTYVNVLTPKIVDLAQAHEPKSILDAGCGVGYLTLHLPGIAQRIVGIDPSDASITIAQSQAANGIEFFPLTMEDYSNLAQGSFELVIANMVLMDVIDLTNFLAGVRKVLRPNGTLIFSITHPWFWPKYYGYADYTWFHYENEIIIESPFRISLGQEETLMSTHVHRPLSSYFEAFKATGFSVELLDEPMPSPEISVKYPVPWHYPRYLLGVCRC